MSKKISSLALALVLTAIGTAHADVSKKVQKAFRGDILITQGPLPEVAGDDAEVISAYKKARAKSLKHTESDGVAEWSFDYTAFLKKQPKITSLSVDFYTADKDKLYVANKGLMGIDPNLPILSGTLTINEDDGLNRGRTYLVKITGKVRGRDVTFAETKVTMK
jgi:hypothetical protein